MDPLFWEVHSGLAHEAPGRESETLKALALTGLSGSLRVLDAGAGPGAASVTLLKALPEAHVLAMELHQPFLDAALARADAMGVSGRLSVCRGDMAAPPVEDGSLDLIWSEGAIYSLGIADGLRAWRPFLATGGRIVFSDVIWTTENPHPAAREFWNAEYPGMEDRAGVVARVSDAGLMVQSDFALAEDAWNAYYGPLGERVDALAAIHGAAHPVLVETRAEIAMRRDHGSDYAYRFFVVSA